MANNIFSELLSLSKELAPWQNEAIRRMFPNRDGVLPQKDKDEIFDLAQIEHGLKATPAPPADMMLKPEDLPAPPVPGRIISLSGVRKLVNVNTLKSDQRLSIGKQLTVIYGENASGKSGYARVMKKAFRARVIEPVLPDVYGTRKVSGPASAIFEIEENGVVRDEQWIDGAAASACLGRFSVFDAKCARVYIINSNELSFLPYGFDIIRGLGSITDDVKRRFQDIATQSAPKQETIRHLIDDTLTGRLVASLNPSSKEEEIRSKATWGTQDANLLKSKEEELARLNANSPQAVRQALQTHKKHLEAVRSAVTSVATATSATKIEEIKRKVAELIKYEQAVEAAAKAAFGGLDIKGIGSEVWRALLIAAEKYSTQLAYPGQPYPPTAPDVKCVLCLQPLNADAQKRIKGFWDFIHDDTSNKRDQARRSLDLEKQALAKLPRQVPKEIEILEEALRASGSKVQNEIKKYYPAVAQRIQAIESAVASNRWDSIPIDPTSPIAACDAEIQALDQRLRAIVDDAQIAILIKSLEAEIAELKAKQRLNQSLSLALAYLKALKRTALATSAAAKITTYSITAKATYLQNKFVTEEFKKRVLEALKPFSLDRVKTGIDRKSEKGKVLHRVTIEGATSADPDAVFSEGERTAISLACFLAELRASDDNCGIILDDPVSSLDHRIRAAAVTMLVSEARERQVVIFTHDLVFFRELWQESDRQQIGIKPQNVEALGKATGILTEKAPWFSLNVGQRISELEKILKEAKDAEAAANPEEYRRAIYDYYDSLRATWERAVEELLFNRVVERLQKEVKTNSLDQVYVDHESVEAVFKGMTRISSIIKAHDHATAQNTSLPNSNDATDDLRAFKDFVDKQKTKRKAAQEKHAHLKK